MRIPRAGYVQEMSIFIAEKLQTSPGIQYRKCANSLTRIEASSLQIHCLSERGYNVENSTFAHITMEMICKSKEGPEVTQYNVFERRMDVKKKEAWRLALIE